MVFTFTMYHKLVLRFYSNKSPPASVLFRRRSERKVAFSASNINMKNLQVFGKAAHIITKITSMKESDKEHIFLRKIAIQFEPKDNTGSRVQYITNVDCQTKKRVGPTWMKPSTYSQNLLHDGFLYGMENENGEMTGYLNFSYKSV